MNDYKRKNGRLVDQIREVSLERDFVPNSDGSVLISQGNTRVLCTANIENKSPAWLKGTDKGWITAEYSMLPGSANNRINQGGCKGETVGADVGNTKAHRTDFKVFIGFIFYPRENHND